jgi:hypothetical protein
MCCRPPNAFTRKRDFSAAEAGHVVLLEYMEQQVRGRLLSFIRRCCQKVLSPNASRLVQPPLLNRPGMGAKLVTYYRKRDPADVDFQKLKQGRLLCC